MQGFSTLIGLTPLIVTLEFDSVGNYSNLGSMVIFIVKQTITRKWPLALKN